jgi:pSer/pThr/pTyr-binding forkhead associated (FHA) protein
MPRNAYLVLQGTRVIPLNRPLIKIGRQLDNHIILEDPRVSRAHAQIKLINERFVIFDMNSTGGTFVNGQPASQSVLYPGDVVSLAGVVFIFSQEMPARPGDMKIIELGSPYAADRPTAIIHRDEINTTTVGPKDLVDLPKTGPL